jgi:large repetitive protein
MQFTHTNWFYHVCRVVLFTFSFSLFHPATLGVPKTFDLKFRISDAGSLVLDFGPWTLDLGPASAYGQVQDPNLASTPEADTSDPFIVQKAAELGRDPNASLTLSVTRLVTKPIKARYVAHAEHCGAKPGTHSIKPAC